MEYIQDKNLYSAVMFALKMCPNLQYARDSKISIAANYYHVNYVDVFKIVQKELWKRAKDDAKKEGNRWYTILNHYANGLLNLPPWENMVFICPQCGAHYSCSSESIEVDKIFISQCSCGFIDEFRRKYVRRDIWKGAHKYENTNTIRR